MKKPCGEVRPGGILEGSKAGGWRAQFATWVSLGRSGLSKATKLPGTDIKDILDRRKSWSPDTCDYSMYSPYLASLSSRGEHLCSFCLLADGSEEPVGTAAQSSRVLAYFCGYMATLNSSLRDGETAQLLGALAVLPEDLVSDSQDPHGGHSHLSLQFRGIRCTLPISVDIRHVCGADTHVRKALIHINNKSCF